MGQLYFFLMGPTESLLDPYWIWLLARQCENMHDYCQIISFWHQKRHRIFHKVARHDSKLTFKTDLDHLPARVFFYFQTKHDVGSLGTKRRIGDELEVLKTRRMSLVGFRASPLTKCFKTQPDRLLWFFRVLPRPPKPPKHVSNNLSFFFEVGVGACVFWYYRGSIESLLNPYLAGALAGKNKSFRAPASCLSHDSDFELSMFCFFATYFRNICCWDIEQKIIKVSRIDPGQYRSFGCHF